jgi:hypothetical protein
MLKTEEEEEEEENRNLSPYLLGLYKLELSK